MTRDSEAYRHACECLSILDMPFNARRPHIDRIERARSVGAADHIRLTLKTTPREVLESLIAGAE